MAECDESAFNILLAIAIIEGFVLVVGGACFPRLLFPPYPTIPELN